MIETERLLIRRFEVSDENGFIALIRDKMSSQYSDYDEQYPTDEAEIARVFEYFMCSNEFYAIVEKSAKRLIGYVTLNSVDSETRNLGYCLLSNAQGHGFATEAASAMVDYAKKQGSKRLVAGAALENAPSINVLKRLNFNEVKRGVGSFKNDAKGAPVCFTACEFELKLN